MGAFAPTVAFSAKTGNSSPKSNESCDNCCQDNRRIYKGKKKREFHESALFSTRMDKPKLQEDTSEDYYTCGQPETSYQFDNSALTGSKPNLIWVLTSSQSRPDWSLTKCRSAWGINPLFTVKIENGTPGSGWEVHPQWYPAWGFFPAAKSSQEMDTNAPWARGFCSRHGIL